jgi:hypothetical protein
MLIELSESEFFVCNANGIEILGQDSKNPAG